MRQIVLMTGVGLTWLACVLTGTFLGTALATHSFTLLSISGLLLLVACVSGLFSFAVWDTTNFRWLGGPYWERIKRQENDRNPS